MSVLLDVDDVTVHHGQLPAIRGLSLRVPSSGVLAVIGANGAGKSTLLGSIAGLLRPTSGRITFDGTDVTSWPTHRRVEAGIALVPEGRRLFESLTVEENLLVGAYRKRPGPWSLDRVLDLFPWMRERARQRGAQLSGGEQQAVAIGRALMSNPRLLLLDEVSLGLAPIVVRRLYEALPQILDTGTAVLLVEQDVSQAMRVASEVVCLLSGRAVLSGRPENLSSVQVEQAYFGRASQSRTEA
ncbi:MAG TPA: ABC transporter ATP-binding protein [Micromonosporaceae bacterium]|jgi:branched-chain amino acid transport system ATP-binding protein